MEAAGSERPRTIGEPLRSRLPELMRAAIAEARLGDRPFGCVIASLDTGEILIRERNRANLDVFGHAEILAIRRLLLERIDAGRSALISTAEPCPMCAWACFRAGVSTVVFGSSIRELIRSGVPQIDLSATELFERACPRSEFLVIEGVLREETNRLYFTEPR